MNRRISVNTGLAVPQSFITKGKQRLKQHIDTVYLNNGDEFEIELYNPTNNKVLAKVELNGNSIGNGIILRPGERIFLERYLDEAKKFLFETYFVDDVDEVKEAIKNNGDVTVKFYNECKTNVTNTRWYNNPFTLTTNTGSPFYGGNITYTNSTNDFTSNSFYNTSVNDVNHIETGRVEKGSYSTQEFTYDNSSFYTFPFHTNWWMIKPQSIKPIVREDLVVYCTECGAKRKKDNHKFCPHCGNKF